MKKALIILVNMLIVSIFVIPTMAANVFEADIIKCGSTGTVSGCGSNPPATDPLEGGKVEVDEMGKVQVQLTGAAPNTTYTVFVGNWISGNGFQFQFTGTGSVCGGEIGTVRTNNNGNFEGPVNTGSGDFAFPDKTLIGQPNFAFNNPACSQTQFTTGFLIGEEGVIGAIFCVPGVKCVGTNGDDIIIGTDGDDEIDGGNGNDRIFGNGGNDKINGGNGDDRLIGGDGDDELRGGNGRDTLLGGEGNDKLKGENGNDTLTGGPGRDKLEGGNGADTLDGGPGNDDLKGGNGPDILICGPGSDEADGGRGPDSINNDCEDVDSGDDDDDDDD